MRIDLRKQARPKSDLPYDPRSLATILRYVLLLYLRRITEPDAQDPTAFAAVQPLIVKLRRKIEKAHASQAKQPFAAPNQYGLYMLREIEQALDATPAKPDRDAEVAHLTALTLRLTRLANSTLSKRASRIES